MRFLFVIDPLAGLNPRKDSSIALMRAAARAQDEVYVVETEGLILDDQGARVHARRLQVSQSHSPWQQADDPAYFPSEHFDAAFMRMDPPVDARFATATLILEAFACPVFNAPRALREMNEKLSIFRFPELIPPTVVSADVNVLREFHSQNGGAVFKPLDGMGGRGIYVSPPEDKNMNSVLEMQGCGREWIMAQKYLLQAREGDARVFVIDGEPAQWMLLREPSAEDHRSNLAAGGTPRALATSADGIRIGRAVGPVLAKAGVLFAGVDVIGGHLTEINITCPTGLVEVRDQTGEDLAEAVLDAARARIS